MGQHMGTLYIVGTPIGNLGDMTFRALETLRAVSLIVAEDTRRARVLLNHFDIDKPTLSLFEHNEAARVERVLRALDAGDVALISEAGMPGLSDPGYDLIRAALAHGVTVTPIPGPTAAIAALVASGLPTDAFVFLGFLPRRAADRRRLLRDVSRERRTLVAYEAPHRLAEALADIQHVLGDRAIAVARELTKRHEEIWRGAVSGARARFTGEVLGEVTLVVAGAPEPQPWSEPDVRAAVAQALRDGASISDAARDVAVVSGWLRREVYHIALRLSQPSNSNSNSNSDSNSLGRSKR
ncbi:MAG TPA: 16S rRNA (cytidine(1402)-2'-O)-methyltransferase [Anaerolineae bacterium]|nr:16S rRNA (cytidine(1402)-2'-O)-methyltransferase [Anaerolineae bacterium]